MPQTTLYLRPEERKIFEKLPEPLRDGWVVREETLQSFESPRQIQMRLHLADFRGEPALEKVTQCFRKGGDLSKLSLAALPTDAQSELYFAIGARGVTILVEGLLRKIRSDDDLLALSLLTSVRHKLLELNAHPLHT
jgi:hypothetical protein